MLVKLCCVIFPKKLRLMRWAPIELTGSNFRCILVKSASKMRFVRSQKITLIFELHILDFQKVGQLPRLILRPQCWFLPKHRQILILLCQQIAG
jgi:hypothetical protein